MSRDNDKDRNVRCSFCGKTQEQVISDRELYASEEICQQMESLTARLINGEPLAYILGEWEFHGLPLYVNEHVLIPRQDTEILVEEVLKELHDGMRILDMCTGSGCILISLLRYSNDCVGVGADISEKALLVAGENGKKLLGDHDVKWIHTDLFEKVEGKFDRIVSNPPYIRSQVIDTLMPEVREHEPLSALDGSEDGLIFYRKIIREAPKYLEYGGLLYFEIGYDQGEDVKCLMEEAGFIDVEVVQDYAGLDRVVYGTYIK